MTSLICISGPLRPLIQEPPEGYLSEIIDIGEGMCDPSLARVLVDEGHDRIKGKPLLLKEQLAYNAMEAWINKDPNELIRQTKLL